MSHARRIAMVGVTLLSTLLLSSTTAGALPNYSPDPDETWVPNGIVNAMVRHGDRLYIGGQFTALINPRTGERARRPGLAALDAATGQPVASWRPEVAGQVWALDVGPDGTVYAGGTFTSQGSAAADHLAAFTATGDPVPGWTAATANNTVHDLVATGDGVYVGGSFGQVNGVSRNGMARLDAAGELDRTFNARLTGGRVRAMTRAGDGTLVIGGTFQQIHGLDRPFTGRVDPTTGEPTGWAPQPACDSCPVLDLSLVDGTVYGGTAGRGGRAVAWSLASGARLWVARGDGDVQAIDAYDGLVFAAGHFGPDFAGQERHQLAVLDAGTGELAAYAPRFTGNDRPGIWAVLAEPEALHLGGAFDLAGAAATRYARLPMLDGPPPPAAPLVVSMAGDLSAASFDSAARFTWSTDRPAQVASYRVETRSGAVRRPLSAWTTTETATTRETTTVPLEPGATVCVRVTATDTSGGQSLPSEPSCRTAPVDDARLKARGEVRRLTGDAHYQDTVTRANGRASKLKLARVGGKSEAMVLATTCPRCGRVRVLYDGTRVTTLSLRTPSRSVRQALELPDPSGVSRIVLKPAGKRKILVDGLLLMR